MKIKIKFILGLSIILVVLGIVLNVVIREALETNMENTISSSLKEVMNGTEEYVKYELVISSYGNSAYELDDEGFDTASFGIFKYVSLNYKCTLRIISTKGKIMRNSIDNKFYSELSSGTKAAQKGKAVVDLKYDHNKVYSILSYPVYEDGDYVGIINVCKDYSELYSDNIKIINYITIIEVLIFLCIFVLSFFITSRITKPISQLTEAVKKVGDGDYDYNTQIRSNDEIGILSREFINMESKIKEQIKTIQNEKEKVKKLEKMRKEFFDNVTHELKTPLTAISGYAEAMTEGIVEDEEFKNRGIKRIYSESERLHQLVLKLISVSKGASFIDEETKLIDMKILLDEICWDMNIKAKKYLHTIVSEVKGGKILGQSNKIRELVINILDNAIKYSNKEEKIYIRDDIEGNYYKLEVENKSCPIPDDIYRNIFNPFVKSRKNIEQGSSGLGLYICSEIVKEHNGQIYVENGENIRVIIKIPVSETT